MSSFPNVLSATLQAGGYENPGLKTFTVPAEYAFAVVQVCMLPKNTGSVSLGGTVVRTSHGSFTFGETIQNESSPNTKDLPILNLIIKGGESFNLINTLSTLGDSNYGPEFTAKITALCHKKPS